MDYVIIKGKKFKVKKKVFYWPYYVDKEKHKALKIETLDLHNQNIDDISEVEGLESLTNLIRLSLSRNKITEIKGLENLSNLEVLTLDYNQITEIKGLKGLSNLKYLSVSYNEITEIEGLEGLPNLGTVILGNNRITEIKGLERLYELDWLGLVGNKITEIKGLENLSNLEVLTLDYNQITEIKGLKGLSNLRDLDVSYNEITEIEGLDSLIDLKELSLNENQITEIKGLENLTNLKALRLENNNITEIRGLKGFIKLKRLHLSHNQIKEIKGLESLYELEHLDLRGNHDITKIEGLENLQNLNSLNIGDNSIPYDIIESLGGFYKAGGEKDTLERLEGWFKDGKANNPQKFVEYCRERGVERRKEKEIKDKQIIEEVHLSKGSIDVKRQAETTVNQIMDLGHDVFICHSNKDKKIADAACHILEQNGIKCWIAPRDVRTGSYATSIVEAIENSNLMILIFTNNANLSNHVKRELEQAVKKGITIQPFRTEDVKPIPEIDYACSSMHWLDALTPPIETHLTELVGKVSYLLDARK